MTARTWLRMLAAGVALLGLTGCSAADRAVLGAPPCPDGPTARPEPPAARPGAVWAWGPMDGAPEGTEAPAPVPGLTDVVSVADGRFTTAAVRADGTVWTYGTDIKGSLGQGAAERRYVAMPRRVPGVDDARAVYAVGPTFFVVRRDGTVWAWGDDRFLVDAGKRDGHAGVTRPRAVPGVKDVVSVAPGPLNAFTLRSDGRVQGWGVNLTQVLGESDGTRLTTIDGVRGVVDVAPAGGAVVAARSDGLVCAWGNNAHGLLGVEPRGGQSGRPVHVTGLTGVVQVAGGHDTAYALDRDGVVHAWGRGAGGALGDGDTSDHSSATPARVTGLPPIRGIAAYGLAGLAVDARGGLWAWGSGLALDGGPAARPVRVRLPAPALAVSGRHVILADAGA
ncbi:RCC1 repeat domain-containing protein [Streptomyces althioticus]|uniref:RCC1 domain-containing protein n=1 Tax=Streptomyces althioticus TaxID=83380 RepID=UPI0033E90BD0